MRNCKWNDARTHVQACNSCVCEFGSVLRASNLLPVCPAWLRTNPPLLGGFQVSLVLSVVSRALFSFSGPELDPRAVPPTRFLGGSGRQDSKRAQGREMELLALDRVHSPTLEEPLPAFSGKVGPREGVTLA